MAELAVAPANESLIGRFVRFANSSVGSKVVMAITGLGLWAFIIAHLAGNLTVYLGPDVYNHYAMALKGNPILLWGTRLALIAGFPLHIWAALRSSAINSAARPKPYAYKNNTPVSAEGATMLISGLIILVFFVYHLAHFTWHLAGPAPVDLGGGNLDVYSMLVNGFRNPLIALLYVAGQILLANHLSHGIYSLFQHLGLWGQKWSPFIRKVGMVVGWGIAVAFASIPIFVLAGVIK